MTHTEILMQSMSESVTADGLQITKSVVDELCANGTFDTTDHRGRMQSYKNFNDLINSRNDATYFVLMKYMVEYGYTENLSTDTPHEMKQFLSNAQRWVKKAFSSSQDDNYNKLFSELIRRR